MAENKWGTGFTTPISGDTTLLISGRNPPCRSTNPILLVPAMTRTNSKGKVLQNDMETKKKQVGPFGCVKPKTSDVKDVPHLFSAIYRGCISTYRACKTCFHFKSNFQLLPSDLLIPQMEVT